MCKRGFGLPSRGEMFKVSTTKGKLLFSVSEGGGISFHLQVTTKKRSVDSDEFFASSGDLFRKLLSNKHAEQG